MTSRLPVWIVYHRGDARWVKRLCRYVADWGATPKAVPLSDYIRFRKRKILTEIELGAAAMVVWSARTTVTSGRRSAPDAPLTGDRVIHIQLDDAATLGVEKVVDLRDWDPTHGNGPLAPIGEHLQRIQAIPVPPPPPVRSLYERFISWRHRHAAVGGVSIALAVFATVALHARPTPANQSVHTEAAQAQTAQTLWDRTSPDDPRGLQRFIGLFPQDRRTHLAKRHLIKLELAAWVNVLEAEGALQGLDAIKTLRDNFPNGTNTNKLPALETKYRAQIKDIQRELYRLGYGDTPIDGTADRATVAAILDVQRRIEKPDAPIDQMFLSQLRATQNLGADIEGSDIEGSEIAGANN